MNNLNFSNIDVLLVDPDHGYRQGIIGMLRDIGVGSIRQGANFSELKEKFKEASPDLLISEVNLPDGNFCSFVFGLRHDVSGGNPFAAVLALAGDPTPDLVRRVVDSGADSLLVKPLSGKMIEQRIVSLISSRKPFVVTSDYIGPTRRNESDRGSEIPLLDVPNVLRYKATGTASPEETQKAIDEAMSMINHHKLERYAYQIGFLVDNILPKLHEGNFDKETEQFILRLNFVAQDTGRRLVGTKYSHVSELCASLLKVAKDIRAANGKPTERDVNLLKPLSDAIQTGFESGTEETALEIASSVGQS